MIEMIKEKIWNLLKEKKISLAMIYDREGKILWHKGRDIEGKNVVTGDGFCKSYIEESLKSPCRIDIEDCIKSDPQEMSKSALSLMVKSVIIHPINHKYFLYIDSGIKEFFTVEDRSSFKMLGELLEQIIIQARDEADTTGLSGSSGIIEKIRETVVKYSLEEEPILLSGETGVGKNHIAGLIHRFSGRKGKFLIVDTPNIDNNLFESKLFGHKKGAFTDAKFDKTGLVEEAAGGTLFFDEITEVPLDVQAKLLRFIDTHKYYILGESTEKEANVRIIAATNQDTKKSVENKEFRSDLYYRLNVLEIQVPPLRERTEDIKSLVMENRILLREKKIGPGFWDVMYNHDWPGNVRELLNILKRAGIILEGPITGEKISSLMQADHKRSDAAYEHTAGEETEDLKRSIKESLKKGDNFWNIIWQPFIARDLDRKTVKTILGEFYEKSAHSFKKMIKNLNLAEKDYQKFMSLLYQYNIDPRK